MTDEATGIRGMLASLGMLAGYQALDSAIAGFLAPSNARRAPQQPRGDVGSPETRVGTLAGSETAQNGTEA